MFYRQINNHVGVLALCLFGLSGCVSVQPAEEIVTRPQPVEKVQGVYHKVQAGETLFQIAQAYQIPVHEVAAANRIPEAAQIEEDQLLVIPGAQEAVEIATVYSDDEKKFSWPVKGKILKYFHERYGREISQGIDIAAKPGEEVRSARTGKVVFADHLPGWGETVILDHHDGYYSVYAKNAQLLVDLNQWVKKAAPIAQVGRSSRLSYLHFEIRKGSLEDNPLYYLP